MSARPKATVRFLRFHRENTHAYGALVSLTRNAKRHLGAPISIWLVYQGLRWETYIDTSGDPYRLSNDFTPYYSRLIMHLNDDLRGVFVVKQSVADSPARLVDADQMALWPDAQRDDGWLEEAARAIE